MPNISQSSNTGTISIPTSTAAIPTHPSKSEPEPQQRLPIGLLLIFGGVAFTVVFAEVTPVGLLHQMSLGLGIAETLTGQFVSVLAFTAAATAIPLSMFVARFPRRALLVTILLGFTAASLFIGLSSSFWLILAARIVNGAFLGILWSMLPGYLIAIIPSNRIGRGLAFITAGVSGAFAFGPSLSSFLGELLGWRSVWFIGAGLAAVLAFLVQGLLPRVVGKPQRPRNERSSFASVLRIPGLLPILFATGTYMLSHNIAFTYILPTLRAAGITQHVDLVLLGFGFTSLIGVWLAGTFIDLRLRAVAIATTVLSALGLVFVATSISLPVALVAVTFAALVLWGLAYGSAPTVFQTAAAHVSGEHINAAQSVLVTVWNSGIGLGSLLGGVLLGGFGITALVWVAGALMIVSALVVALARRHGFAQ